MDSKAAASLSTAQMDPSSKAPRIKSLLFPFFSSFSSSSSSSTSLPIRAPLSSSDGEENDDERHSQASSTLTEFDSYHSGGEDGFETASERPFAGDPDDETLEIPQVEAGLLLPPKAMMPIAQLSSEDDEDHVIGIGDEVLGEDIDGDGYPGVVRIPLSSLLGSEIEEIGVLGDGGKDPSLSLEGNSPVESVENQVPVDSAVGDPDFRENSEIEVMGSGEKDLLVGRNSAEDSILVENSLQVKKVDILLENLVVGENASPATEEFPDIQREELESVKLKDGAFQGEKSGVDLNSEVGIDSTVGTASKTNIAEEVAEGRVSKNQLEDSAGGKTSDVGVRSDQFSSLIEEENVAPGTNVATVTSVTVETAQPESPKKLEYEEVEPSSTDFKAESVEQVDSKQTDESVVENNEALASASDEASPFTEVVANSEIIVAGIGISGENDAVGSEEKPISVSNAIIGTLLHDSHEDPGVEVLGAKSDELSTDVAADGCNSTSTDPQTIPAGGIESESRGIEDCRYESQIVSGADKSVEVDLNNESPAQTVLAGHSKELDTDKETLGDTDVTLDGALTDNHITEHEISRRNLPLSPVVDAAVNRDSDDSRLIRDIENEPDGSEDEDLASEEDALGPASGASKTAEQIIRDIEQSSFSSQSGFGSSWDYSQKMDGQITTDSDEEVNTEEEGDGKEQFDSAALAALLKAASSGGPDGSITINPPDAARLFSAGLGPRVPSLRPAPARPNRYNITTPSEPAVVGETDNNMDDKEKKLHENIQEMRVKFLRLVLRLGYSTDDTVVTQVLYRLGLAEGIRWELQPTQPSIQENTKKAATQMETANRDDLDFSCNILILGKTGVGKSATINSIFGEEKTPISAFEPKTTAVREIIGTVGGVKIRVIDTPGLRSSVMDQSSNKRILSSIKKFTKKCPPDIVLYIDRIDSLARDSNDLSLLRSISTSLGPSIWLNAIVALTHAGSAPPDGPNGLPLSYEVFVAQRSHIIQHSIRQAAGDMRLMNPVALIENHPSCRKNREGQRVLPNGQNWRSHLLLLCYSSMILSEANSLLKLQDPYAGKRFGFHVRSPPLPYLLSSLLQSRAHPKLTTNMGGENADSDVDLDDMSDSDHDEEEEYDQLPPFKPLKKSQFANLSKEQRKAYLDEYDYRVKLLQKKQWREELRRLRNSKKEGKEDQDNFSYRDMGGEDFDQENGSPAAIPVPMPDMVLPASFDGDNPAYRYRFLEPVSQLLVRPVLDTHGWDHDCGYDGVSLEESLAVANRFPAAVSVQITKDKKEFNIHLESSLSAKHGESGSTLAGFDVQNVGKQLAYILRSEAKFCTFKKNKTAAGVSVTFLGENVVTGLKVEDRISIGKRMNMAVSTGTIHSQGDVAYGANLEACLRDKEYPICQDQSTFGLSLMRWRGDLALGANLQSQFSVGRNSKMMVRVGLNNKLSGQITVRTSSSEQLQIALVGIIPVAFAIFKSIWPGESYLSH